MTNLIFLTKLGTVILLVCFLCMPSCKAAIGDDCVDDGNCTYADGKCMGDTCGCADTHYIDGSACQQKISLEGNCNSTGPADQCAATNAECRDSGGHKCLCLTTHYKSGTACLEKISLEGNCNSTGPADQCAATNAECRDSGGHKCLCLTTHYKSGTACLEKISLEGSCSSTEPAAQCETTNAECRDSGGHKCLCLTTHYKSGTACLEKIILEGSCSSTEPAAQCVTTNAECRDSGGHKCLCLTTHYKSGTACLEKIILEGNCNSTEPAAQCVTTNAECRDSGGHKCLCLTTHYKSGTACLKKISLEGSCSSTEPAAQCVTTNAECRDSGGHKCLCLTTHYKSGTACLEKISLEGSCSSTEPAAQCVTTNAECRDSGGHKCLCLTTHYKSGTACLEKISLEGSCSSTEPAAQCVTTNAECRDSGGHKCLCLTTHYKSGTACLEKISLEGSCSSTEPAAQCVTTNAECRDSGGHKCLCLTTHYKSGTACLEKISLEGSCSSTEPAAQCVTTNAECRDSGGHKCLCLTTHYKSGTACLEKISLEGSCSSTEPAAQCVTTNAECRDSGGHKCLCLTTHYKSGTACLEKISLEGSCSSTEPAAQCVTTNAECRDSGGHKCLCLTTHYKSGTACLEKISLEGSCSSTEPAAQCVTTNAECRDSGGHKCLCLTTHYKSGTACLEKISLEGSCSSTEPAAQCVTTNAECRDSGGHKCLCLTTHYKSGTACLEKISLEGSCSSTEPAAQCVTTNAECRDSGGHKCLCLTTHYKSGTACLEKISLEGSCSSTEPAAQCVTTNAECRDSGGHKCLCLTTHYKSGTACLEKISLEGSCSSTEPAAQCVTTNAECRDSGGHKCLCLTTHYKSGTACLEKVALNAACTTGQPNNQCADTNAACQVESGTQSTYKCLCKSAFYENKAGICAGKSALGAPCTSGESPLQCSVTQTECISDTVGVYKCTCMANYYRDGQTCKALTDLQVLNPDVPDDTTGETYFLVTWNHPTTVGFINGYQLTLTALGQTEDPIHIDKTKTNFNVTNRVQGRKYTITVRSLETASRPGNQTTEVTITDGTRPAIPGASTQSVFNGPQTTISWTITGDVEHFSGTINDTSASPSTFNLTAVNRQPPPLTVSDLRHGERYSFTVRSHSNGFTSDSYIQTIRTTPTTPSPPTNFVCTTDNIFDRSMTLTWKEPVPPNGDILNFIITDKSSGRQIQTSGSAEQQLVDQLQPETYYKFTIKTVNDAQSGTSAESNSTNCQTKTALATPPQNLTSSDVTSRSMKTHWGYPAIPGGVIQAYRLTVRNITDDSQEVCVQEILLQCTGCELSGNLNFVGNCGSQELLNKTPEQIANQTMSHLVENLYPYVKYRVRIQAVNAKGNGNYADIIDTTLEETPQKPTVVTGVAQSDPKVLQVSWQQPLPRPGITTYTVRVYEENDEMDSFIYKETFNKDISGYYTQTATIDGLEEYWRYQFELQATTAIGSFISDRSAAVRTTHAAPGSVENFMVSHPTDIYDQMDVKWSIPSRRKRNSVITHYVVKHNISVTGETLSVPVADNVMRRFNVTPEETYLVEVYAVNMQDQNGDEVHNFYFALPGPPTTPPVDALVGGNTAPPATQSTIKVTVILEWFLNTEVTAGKRTDGGLLVLPESNSDYGSSTQRKKDSHFLAFHSWKKSKKSDFDIPWRVTNSTWVEDISSGSGRRKRSNQEIQLLIGEDTQCDKFDETVYCNGPLPAGRSFIIVTFVCTNGGCTESDQFGPYATQPVPDDKLPIGIIAGAVAAVVAVIIVIVIIILVKKRRNRHKPMKEEEPVDFGNPAGLQTPSMERKNIKMKRPTKMSDFAAKIEELHRDSNLKFAHEYEEVKVATDPKTMKGATTELAETDENKLKNRYVNILPYDKTIVKLLPLEDDDEYASTFINANYIPGYKSQREYIASQGPIPSTIDDFWRMVWEQSVSIIVMLTLCKEDGRIKCECYWPTESSEPKQYRDIVVEMTSCSTINTYEIRIFKLTVGDRSRNIKHFHFLNWKDFSANVQNDVMIDFIQNVRNHVTIPESKVPMIVHCSAGVGRTGTFIALDHLIQFIAEHDFNQTIDIFDMVVKMRQCRMYMVQTEQQYIFIHDCIKDILERKRQKEIESENDGLYDNQLYGNVTGQEQIYDNQAFEPDLYQNVNLNPKTEL